MESDNKNIDDKDSKVTEPNYLITGVRIISGGDDKEFDTVEEFNEYLKKEYTPGTMKLDFNTSLK